MFKVFLVMEYIEFIKGYRVQLMIGNIPSFLMIQRLQSIIKNKCFLLKINCLSNEKERERERKRSSTISLYDGYH